ncbi:MAG: DUF4197 domain-containing protein [Flavobacteriales bacterium]|nr:DUF4197 domain-containing protein [Flavobacteriales bacterium]
MIKRTWKSGGMILMIAFMIGCTDQQVLGTLETVLGNGEGSSSSLTNQEVIAGLKEALNVGIDIATAKASAVDGFNADPRIHIPFPEDAIKVKNTVEDLGLGPQVDQFVVTLNRAAEEASKEAAPIFLNAILEMSIQDGFEILRGDQNAATLYLRDKTYDKLYDTFKPKVQNAVDKVQVGENWTPLANAYNTATYFTGGERVDPDLNNYVTVEAIDGLFLLLAAEEVKIRENPAARVTDLLKKVFGTLDP